MAYLYEAADSRVSQRIVFEHDCLQLLDSQVAQLDRHLPCGNGMEWCWAGRQRTICAVAHLGDAI